MTFLGWFVFSDEVKGHSRNQMDSNEKKNRLKKVTRLESDCIVSSVPKSKLINMCSSQPQQQKTSNCHTHKYVHKYVHIYIYIFVYLYLNISIYLYTYRIYPYVWELFSPHQGDRWSRSNGWDRGNCAYSSHSGHRGLEPRWSQVAMNSKSGILQKNPKRCWFHWERMLFFFFVSWFFEVSRFEDMKIPKTFWKSVLFGRDGNIDSRWSFSQFASHSFFSPWGKFTSGLPNLFWGTPTFRNLQDGYFWGRGFC